MEEVIIRQVISKENPLLYSQVLNLRNQLLRLPIGLDLFQEDLSQEVNHVTFAAITSISAKSNDNNGDLEKRVLPDGNSDGQKPLTGSDNLEAHEEKVVGCLILAPIEGDDKTFKVRQMAVSPSFQGRGVGSKLLQHTEAYTKQQGKTRLYLHGRAHAVGFYLKSGYSVITESEFLELGIPHHALEKIL